MLRLAAGIAARSYAVDLVLIKREGAYLDSIPPGVRLVVLNTRRTLNSVAALAGYLRRERPAAMLTALVHVNVGALLAATLSRLTDTPDEARAMGRAARDVLVDRAGDPAALIARLDDLARAPGGPDIGII